MDIDKLTGAQRRILEEAILDAFSREALNKLVTYEFDKGIEDLIPPAALSNIVFELVSVAQKNTGWTQRLIEAAQRSTDREKMQNIVGELRFLSAKGPMGATASLEKIVRGGRFDNVVTFANTLLQFRRRICRIEGTKMGTGFLVSPELVLTNYHVVDDYINGLIHPKHLVCRFDYSIENKGENQGSVRTLANPGLVAWSKYSEFDPGDQGGQPQLAELDFALLRLSEPVGNEVVGNPIAPDEDSTRGWIAVSSQPPVLKPKSIMVILQHPKGEPLKLAQGMFTALNKNETRIRYDADTDSGSSGSPCFDANLNLVAIHHGGDPEWKHPTFNQGIPIHLIVRHLATRDDVPQFWQ
jgi:V8-like Glu-specific endopeptidase